MTTKKILFSFLMSICVLAGSAQVSIVNAPIMPYNISPDAMLSASVINNSGELRVQMISKLYNLNGQVLITAYSNSFTLKQGLNPGIGGERKVSSTDYASDNQSQYIKTTHSLPSGKFRLCVTLVADQTTEPLDEYCDEIESDFNQFLYLVNPFDKDTIDSKTPLLIWSHSEPFNMLAQGEYYRMIVSEIKEMQNAEEAVSTNTPVMAKNYLNIHSIQYPYDAKELQEGHRYGWQVQKTANGIITNKTEAWEFIIRKKPDEKNMKYVALQQKVGADSYKATNGRVYFKFNEEYRSKGKITAYIISDKGKEFAVEIVKDEKQKPSLSTIKSTGDNRFVLDLDLQNIKPGYYTMKVDNEKRETFYLKFYLPN